MRTSNAGLGTRRDVVNGESASLLQWENYPTLSFRHTLLHLYRAKYISPAEKLSEKTELQRSREYNSKYGIFKTAKQPGQVDVCGVREPKS